MAQIPEIKYLITNHFNGLVDVAISGSWHKDKDSFAYTMGSRITGFVIAFSKKDYKKLSRKQRLGVIAHELAHIQYDLNHNIVQSAVKSVAMKILSSTNSKIEREVDLLAIEMGCGEYLYAFMKYHDKNYKKYNKNDGLTKKEIKQLLETKV